MTVTQCYQSTEHVTAAWLGVYCCPSTATLLYYWNATYRSSLTAPRSRHELRSAAIVDAASIDGRVQPPVPSVSSVHHQTVQAVMHSVLNETTSAAGNSVVETENHSRSLLLKKLVALRWIDLSDSFFSSQIWLEQLSSRQMQPSLRNDQHLLHAQKHFNYIKIKIS